MAADRSWMIYLAQDKHLDHKWCGSQAEIEVRMAALLDCFLDQVERTGSRWNLDCTLWLDVYRRRKDGAEGVFPPAIPAPPETRGEGCSCRRGTNGVEIASRGERCGVRFCSRWFLHAAHPWIDVQHDLCGGWTEEPQSIQVCFPLSITRPVYGYDTAGAIQVAGLWGRAATTCRASTRRCTLGRPLPRWRVTMREPSC